MEPTAMSTSGLLEWELSLPCEHVVSHGWYHGSVGRSAAESLLRQDRQFLVRDSSSQPDNYVLSCKSNGQHLHFVIQRIVVNPETVYERYQYQFEDEAYDTVADLITSYVGSGKPISAASGARIQYPANRTSPLSNFVQTDENRTAVTSPVSSGQLYSHQHAIYSHFAAKPSFHSRPTFKQRSHSLTPAEIIHSTRAKSTSADGVILQSDNAKHFSGDSNHAKHFSGDSNSSSWDAAAPSSPPAKPARADQAKEDGRRLDIQRLYLVSGSDSGNGSGDSTQSQSDPNKRSDDYLATPTIKHQFDYADAESRLLRSEKFLYVMESRINLDHFRSQICRGLSKPLESETLHAINTLLRASGPRILANHMTSVDLKFLLDEAVLIEGLDRSASGLELCFLPQGRQLRIDIIERAETFRLLMAVTILTCQTDRQRADAINDWILLAIEIKTALGNLYGFSCIMAGLCMPQIESLANAWNLLRRLHTDNALMFEAQLRPCYKSMNDGTNPLPPNTTTPNILPPVLCFHMFDREDGGFVSPEDSGSLLNTAEFDLSATAAHLEAARRFPDQVAMFKRNARTVVQEMSSLGAMLDPTLLELFQTEFHMQFLWGERGARTKAAQRFARLGEILTSMAHKVCQREPDESD